MADRFLPADDPVLEEVLNWTVARDAQDIRRLLEWLPLIFALQRKGVRYLLEFTNFLAKLNYP